MNIGQTCECLFLTVFGWSLVLRKCSEIEFYFNFVVFCRVIWWLSEWKWTTTREFAMFFNIKVKKKQEKKSKEPESIKHGKSLQLKLVLDARMLQQCWIYLSYFKHIIESTNKLKPKQLTENKSWLRIKWILLAKEVKSICFFFFNFLSSKASWKRTMTIRLTKIDLKRRRKSEKKRKRHCCAFRCVTLNCCIDECEFWKVDTTQPNEAFAVKMKMSIKKLS